MNRLLLLAISVIAICNQALAQDSRTFTVRTNAINGWTGEAMKTAEAIMLSKTTNDTIHATRSFAYRGYGNKMVLFADLNFKVPRHPDSYILKGYAEGYDTVYATVDIDKVGARETLKEIPELEFYRKSKVLATATVTATKVKFYMAGDTLVYNADAFKLPEGSMLDALINQLPGVELNDNGEIFVNGKKVESLLLNGKDFFKGDRLVMLNNLGAYTVNQVKVYDKLSERSMLAGRDLGDSEFVMDVKLKKEYMNGYICNMEAGAGTAQRYMARLFGMWYTTRSRVTVLGSLNNLNDNRTPGQNTAWVANATPGDTRTKMGGVEYNFNGDGEKWELSGDATVQHTRTFNTADTYTTNFHPDRRTYGTAFANSISHELNVKTQHTLRLRPENQFYSASVKMNYQNSDRSNNTLSGTFNSASEQLNRTLLEQIFNGTLSSFADNPVYTSLTRTLTSGHSLNAGGNFFAEYQIPHTPDLFEFGVNGNYTKSRYGSYNLYDINYNAAGNRATDYQFINNSPDRSWNLSANTGYDFLYSDKGHILISPRWSHTSTTQNSYLYQLDRLSDIGVFGVLPDNYLSALDNDQTYLSHQTDDKASLYMMLHHKVELSGKRSIVMSVSPTLGYTWRRLDYRQGDVHQNVSKNSFYVDAYARFAFNYSSGDQVVLTYNRNTNLMTLNRLVDVVDTRDPLNIFVASTGLKNSAGNNFNLEWHKFNRPKHRWSNYMSLKYAFTENALVNTYSYNPETGVRTYRMQNVSGNWNGSITESFTKTFGAKNQFMLSTVSTAAYSRSTGMLAMTGTEFSKNIVNNLTLNQTLNFTWTLGKQQLGFKGGIKWRDTKGTDSGFKNFSATDAYYGINGVFSLPYRFGISTDLTLYTRNGYAQSGINSTKAVWNGRLTYTVKGGRWLIMLDGFDLLHQLDNVTYNVNDQALTEVYTNVLPRYALLHVQYKFVLQPKKKK